LVTGVARYLGANLAARLAGDPRIDRVIGVDGARPPAEFGGLLHGVEVHRVDLSTPEVIGLMVDADVEAVAHLAIASTSEGGGRAAMKELNVIGTMQLLAACQQVSGLRKLVVRSSTAAYGASFRDPAVFTEDTEPRETPRGGFARDVLDIEGYVRGFRRRRPGIQATVLRFAPFVGPAADTRLLRYFAQPIVPTVFGRDPRLQFIHIDDAFEVLHRSVTESHPGTFNVAGGGVITLSQAVRRAGRLAVPVVEGGLSAAAALSRGAIEFSLDQLDLFVHGRVVDTSRLVKEYGFTPRSTSDAFDDFIRAQKGRAVLGPDAIRAAERVVLDTIRQVREARGLAVESAPAPAALPPAKKAVAKEAVAKEAVAKKAVAKKAVAKKAVAKKPGAVKKSGGRKASSRKASDG
jgi:UDP-glucose 4-epimerase